MEVLLPDASVVTADAPPPRIIIAVDGIDKGGKTRFALTAPRPLVYLDTDLGSEGVMEKADRRDLIIASDKPFMFRTSEVTWDLDDAAKTAAIMRRAEPELERFRAMYRHALSKPVAKVNGQALKARTIVVDNASEIWELLRLCYLGKLTQVKSHHYTEVNGVMRDLVREAYDHDVNVIWIHKLKSEYKENADGKNVKSGVLQRVGFADMSYLVQANLLAHRVASNVTTDQIVKWKSGEGLFELPIAAREENDLGFRLVVGNSRHDPTLEGEVWFNADIDFPTVAMRLRPDVDPTHWYTVV